MTDDPRLERLVRHSLDASAPTDAPAELRRRFTAALATTSPRSRWLALVKEPTMRRFDRVAIGSPVVRASSFMALAAVLLVGLLATAAAAATLLPSPEATPAPVRATGAFTPAAAMPDAMGWLIRPGVVLLEDGRVLVAGGGQERQQAAVYDPATDTWTGPIPLPAMHQGATATRLRDGRVLIVGGNDGLEGLALAAATLFDPRTGVATRTGAMAHARDGHTATLLDDGRVLVVGGFDSGLDGRRSLASAEIYDPATGTFSPTGSLETARADHAAVALPDGSVLVIGGTSDGAPGSIAPLASVERFDPSTGSMHTVAAMGTPRTDAGALGLPDGRVLVVGGATSDPDDARLDRTLASAELFDPATSRFVPAPGSLTTERRRPGLTLLPDGAVLVTGGTNTLGEPATAQRFDPRSGTFQAAGRAAFGHPDPVAVLLTDGRVFLPQAGTPSQSELYAPAVSGVDGPAAGLAPSPGAAGSVPVADVTLRTAHAAITLADDRVLLVGGYGGPDNEPLASAELFDPATGRITPTGSMSTARTDVIAVRMADGRVLVSGYPLDGEGPTLEVYDPGDGTFGPVDPRILQALEGWKVLATAGIQDGRAVLVTRDGDRLGGGERELSVIDLGTGRSSLRGPACRFAGGSVELADGGILEGCGPRPGAIRYDPITGTSEPLAGVTSELWDPIRLPDGTILAAERQGGVVDAVRMTYTLRYDPVTDVVTRLVDDPETSPMRGATVVLPDGRVVLAGGNLGNLSDLVWILDPATGTYRTVGRLLVPRADATATLLPDGRILVAGGAQRSADRTDPVPPGAELLDAATLR